jgi:hypothetical protein
MHYFDPTRPIVANRAAYISPSGKAIAPLPSLCVTPREGGIIEVGMWLLDSRMSSSYYALDATSERSLGEILTAWIADPELFLQVEFDYLYEPGPVRAHPTVFDAPQVSLADLGL